MGEQMVRADIVERPQIVEWRIEGFYVGGPKAGQTIAPCGPPNVRWVFGTTARIRMACGEKVFTGMLEVRYDHGPSRYTGYVYYVGRRLLCINRCPFGTGREEVAGDEPRRGDCWADRYRVRRVRANEYLLYDLDGVEKEPDDYRLGLRATKIKP